MVRQIFSVAVTPTISSKFFHQDWKLLVYNSGRMQPIFLFPVWKESSWQLFVLPWIIIRFSRLYFQPWEIHPEVFDRNITSMCSRIAATESHVNPFQTGIWLEILPVPGRGRHHGGVNPSCCQAWLSNKWSANVSLLCFRNGDIFGEIESQEVCMYGCTSAMAYLFQGWTH